MVILREIDTNNLIIRTNQQKDYIRRFDNENTLFDIWDALLDFGNSDLEESCLFALGFKGV